MEPRDLQILRHIGLHRVSLREILNHCFFGGRSCANVLQRLRDEGFVEESDRLKDGFRYYTLTPQGEAATALPIATSPGPQSLQVALATLWFCNVETTRTGLSRWRDPTMSPRRPTRSLKDLFGAEPPSGSHCIEAAGLESRLYRIYAPSPKTPVQRLMRAVQEVIEATTREPHLEPWVWSRAYALAVLLDDPGRRIEVLRRIKPLREKIHVVVEYAPSPDRLKEAIDALHS